MDQRSEERFVQELRHHLAGWKAKVELDFAQPSYEAELGSLVSDPVYSKFHLGTPEYVLVRLVGRMSISIGRRLGEIYDKLPRFMVQARFGLTREQIAPQMGGRLELDICVPLAALSPDDKTDVRRAAKEHLKSDLDGYSGLGIEIRYNFNPNDSARLRKDVAMADHLKQQQLFPVYLIFAENSPRDEAIARLQRAGWTFLVGGPALAFASAIAGADISSVLDRPSISAEIKREVDEMMAAMFSSYAFAQILPLTRIND